MTVDWNLAYGLRGNEVIGHDGIRAYHQAGGAALLAELVIQVAGRSRQVIEVARPPDPDGASPDDPRVHHSWALWSPGPQGGTGWWVERILGVTRAAGDAPAQRLETGTGRLVVLDDAGLGFPDRPDRT